MSMSSKILTAILTHLKNSSRQDFYDPRQNRRFLENNAKHFKPDPTIGFEKFSIDHIPSAWIIPPNQSSNNVIFYLHGGGCVAGSINTHRDLCSRIAKAAKQKALIIDYRLAPEHPFPTGLNDALYVYQWLIDHHIPPHRITLVGDSAGGNLVISLMLQLKALGIALPSKAAVMSPWLILDTPSRSVAYKPNAEKDPMFTYDVLSHTAKIYVYGEAGDNGLRNKKQNTPQNTPSGDASPWGHDMANPHNVNPSWDGLANPFVSPLKGDLSGLPPLLIQVGTREILLEDSELLARKAKAAGVDVTLEVWDEMFHVWHYFARYLKAGQQAIEKIGVWI